MHRHPASYALGSHLSPAQLGQMIDISTVQATHTEADVLEVARVAVVGGFIAVHALPHFVPLLRTLVPRGATLVGAPVGFPSGGSTTATKLAEAVELVEFGADELDMMINVGRLRSGDDAYLVSEIRAVAAAIAPVPLKVILEVGHLTEGEIRRGSKAAVDGGAAFVKTGTGWLSGATTVEQIRLIADTVQGAVQIKASGGMRSLSTIGEMIQLGVTRFGISARHALALVDACAQLPGGRLALLAEPEPVG